MAAIKVQPGNTVAVKSTGKTGTVSALIPVKSGGRGRPKTTVVVDHDGEDGPSEYAVAELKVLTDLLA